MYYKVKFYMKRQASIVSPKLVIKNVDNVEKLEDYSRIEFIYNDINYISYIPNDIEKKTISDENFIKTIIDSRNMINYCYIDDTDLIDITDDIRMFSYYFNKIEIEQLLQIMTNIKDGWGAGTKIVSHMNDDNLSEIIYKVK